MNSNIVNKSADANLYTNGKIVSLMDGAQSDILVLYKYNKHVYIQKKCT